jgi:hypothetical protein
MHMTSHAATLLSTEPGPARPDPPATDGPEAPTVPLATAADGPAEVVAWSTTYGRQGPEWTALIGELVDGSRCYARLEDPPPADVDLAGRKVTVSTGENRITTAVL